MEVPEVVEVIVEVELVDTDVVVDVEVLQNVPARLCANTQLDTKWQASSISVYPHARAETYFGSRKGPTPLGQISINLPSRHFT